MSLMRPPTRTASMPFHIASLVTLHEVAADVVHVADEGGRVAVAVYAVEEDRDVAVDDVAVDQRAVVGDAVADDLVHRRAQRLRVALVVQRARIAATRDARVVTDAVELVGGDAGPHRRAHLEQHLACRAPRVAHAIGELVGRDRGHERRRVGRVRGSRDRSGHDPGRRQAPGANRPTTHRRAPAGRREPAPGHLLLLLPLAHGPIVAPTLIMAVAPISKYSRIAALAASGAGASASAASIAVSHMSRSA